MEAAAFDGLRDLMLRLAHRYLYASLWSAAIHEEWMRSLLDRTRAFMDEHFPDAVVKGYEAIIATLDLLDPDDYHVLAAGIHGGADIVVTRNLRDFPAERLVPHGLVAQHPDAFIAELFDAEQSAPFGRRISCCPRTARSEPNGIPAATARYGDLTGPTIHIAVARSAHPPASLPVRRRLCGVRVRLSPYCVTGLMPSGSQLGSRMRRPRRANQAIHTGRHHRADGGQAEQHPPPPEPSARPVRYPGRAGSRDAAGGGSPAPAANRRGW